MNKNKLIYVFAALATFLILSLVGTDFLLSRLPFQYVYAGGAPVNPVWDQKHFRFRNDNGSETTATWKAAEDANITGLAKSVNFRVRIETAETAKQDVGADVTPLIEYKLASGGACADTTGWTTITTATTNAFALSLSSQFADKDPTTNQLSSAGGGFSFIAGEILESSNPATAVSGMSKDWTEHEWSMQATTNAADSTAYIFRLSNGTNNTNYNAYTVCPQLTTAAPPTDLTWVTGAADFKIYQSSALTWGAGTLICSGTLTDVNADTVSCLSGSIANSTQYRVDVILKNSGATVKMQGTSEYVDHVAVKAGWAGTAPTLGTCGFNDFGTDNYTTSCSAAWNATNNVRITQSFVDPDCSPGFCGVNIGLNGTEGFMYLITTGSDVPSSNSTSYLDTTIDSNVENSSKITITGPAGGGPTLTFSLGATSVALGTLSATVVTSGSHTIIVGTNAVNGVSVTYSGATLTSGANTITAMSTAAASSVGTEQFGINAVANTTPSVGAACSGTVPIASAATGYSTANNFKFVSGETVVSSAGSINDTTCTISYIANITGATEAGSYSATLTYIATGNF